MAIIRKIDIPRQANATTIVSSGGSVQQIEDYLPAVKDDNDVHVISVPTAFDEVAKFVRILLGTVPISLDDDGNIKIDGNIYATGFISALGSNPDAGDTPSSGGIDVDELWSLIKSVTIQRGGVSVGVYNGRTDEVINIELPTFTEIKNKPTTLAGYGITDAMTIASINNAINIAKSEVVNGNVASATTATRLNHSAGSTNTPVYIKDGKAVACDIRHGGRNYLSYSNLSAFGFTANNGVVTDNSPTSDPRVWSYAQSQHKSTVTLSEGNYLLTLDVISASTSAVAGCQITSEDGTVLMNWNNFSFSTVGKQHALITLTKATRVGVQVKCYEGAYMVKLEKGNVPTDWTPAPEDFDTKLSTIKTEIINGNVASATKLQIARKLWGNSFDGTGDVNGTIKFASGSNGRNMLLSGDGIKLLASHTSAYAFGLSLNDNTGTTSLGGTFGFYGDADKGYVYSYIGDGYRSNNLRVWKGGNVTIGGASDTGYKLDVQGNVRSTSTIYAQSGYYLNNTAGNGVGYSLFGDTPPSTYGLFMANTSAFGKHGYITGGWATYLSMSTNTASEVRGWIFRNSYSSKNVASIDTSGNVTCAKIDGTTAVLGRAMVGYTSEDTKYILKCNGRAYFNDDSEVNGSLTVDSLEATTTIYASNGIWSDGYVSALGSNTSDKRLKTDVKPFKGIDILSKFKFVQFRWNDKAKSLSSVYNGSVNYGVLAQDNENIIEDFVYNLPNSKYKGVRYEKLIPIMGKALQEQQSKIEVLERENAELRREIESIKKSIERLWNRNS